MKKDNNLSKILGNNSVLTFLPNVCLTHFMPLVYFYEVRKIATGKGDDYTTRCLLDYKYFKENYQLIAVDLSKQKELDADPRAIQQIEFYGMLTTNY